MKKSFLTLSILSILSFSSAAFAVNDNITSTEYNTFSPQGGSLSNNLTASGNSANNNGMIGTNSSATANKLDSSITAVTRQDISNQQFGNSSIGNTSNNSAGGYSGGNTLSNTANGGAGGYSTSSSGGNTLSNGQGQEQGQGQSSTNTNANTSSGNSTQVNAPTTINQSSVTRIPQQAPALPGQVNFQSVGTSGGNFGLTTPFGGFAFGANRTVKEAKALLTAQAAQVEQSANTIYVDNVIRACEVVSEEQCEELKTRMMNRF